MDRSQSTSFQQVEDWLRGLGLLQYAQSFYDNGYEDTDTCKEINYEDLDVIGVKSDRDREDIIKGVERLKLNLYFVLEEPVEKPELKTFEPIILKSKLKETLNSKNVQLVQPPYYYPDGTLGDLYPLAITLADELCTHFNDVLDGLEQLRKRQLPAQTYDEMNEVSEDLESKSRSGTTLDPAEYLNCEVNAKNRGYSFSKYDTRVTKSTTDLTKDALERGANGSQKYKINKGKSEKDDGKGKSRFGSIFNRKDTVKGGKGNTKEPHYDFRADELAMSEKEICDMFSKVKNNEMSQEEVLAAVKRKSGGKHSPNTTLERTPEHSASLGKSKKGKISKQMIKRTPSASATFYTSKDDSTPYMIPAGENNNSLERSRSGSSLGGDEAQQADSAKSSPEVGKSGFMSKLRSSIRKKPGKNENDETNLSQSGSLSSQENIALSDVSGKSSPEVKRLDISSTPPAPPLKPSKPEISNVYQDPIPILSANKPTPPMKPRKSEGEWEVFEDDNAPPQSENTPIKTEIAKRLSNKSEEDGFLGPGKGLILDLSKSKLKPVPKPPVRQPKTSTPSQEEKELPPAQPATPTTPVAPPRARKKVNPATPGTPVDALGIDDIGRKMDSLIAGLNDRLNDIEDNYVDDTQLENLNKPQPVKPSIPPAAGKPSIPPAVDKPSIPHAAEKPSIPPAAEKPSIPPAAVKPSIPSAAVKPTTSTKPLPPSRKPMLPPRRIEDSKNSPPKSVALKDNETGTLNEKKMFTPFTPLPLKRILWKKLKAEGVRLHETPYTIKDGEWNVPYQLVKRYVDELGQSANDIVHGLEELRKEECFKAKLPIVAYSKEHLHSHQLPKDYSLNQWLIYHGLPMFIGDLQEVNVTTIQQVNGLNDADFKSIGVYQEKHIDLLKSAAKQNMEKSSIVYC